jgi:ribosomal-protein-alanine N-acetyltransferase
MEGLAGVSWRPPPLTSARLLLRGYEPTDADAIFVYASHEEVTRYMAWERHRSLADTAGFLDGFIAPSYATHQHEYVLCLREQPQRAIGGMGIRLLSEQHQTYELGYVLSRDHWGQGLVPEAARLLIGHVFATLPAERIQATVFGENERSRRAALKMGLKLDGVLRSALHFRGRRWDEVVFSILRSEWSP